MQLALAVGANGDDEHIPILKFHQRLPKIVHPRRSVLEVNVRRQRDARRVEAKRAHDLNIAGVLADGSTRCALPRGPACSVLVGNVLLEAGQDGSPFRQARHGELFIGGRAPRRTDALARTRRDCYRPKPSGCW
jgi:hypothetical protein